MQLQNIFKKTMVYVAGLAAAGALSATTSAEATTDFSGIISAIILSDAPNDGFIASFDIPGYSPNEPPMAAPSTDIILLSDVTSLPGFFRQLAGDHLLLGQGPDLLSDGSWFGNIDPELENGPFEGGYVESGTIVELVGHWSENISSVPEPPLWVMMIVSFAGLGSVLRKHRSKCDRIPIVFH